MRENKFHFLCLHAGMLLLLKRNESYSLLFAGLLKNREKWNLTLLVFAHLAFAIMQEKHVLLVLSLLTFDDAII